MEILLLHQRLSTFSMQVQSWTGRLKNQLVIAANTGFRSGYVHFAIRSATGRNLVEFLKEHAPPGAEQDGTYGQGHEQASGGALHLGYWAAFLDSLGFRTAQHR